MHPGTALPRRHHPKVAAGMTTEDILAEHPDLEPADIPAALNYAAEALAEHYYPLRPPA